jgi:hypothetical protein
MVHHEVAYREIGAMTSGLLRPQSVSAFLHLNENEGGV